VYYRTYQAEEVGELTARYNAAMAADEQIDSFITKINLSSSVQDSDISGDAEHPFEYHKKFGEYDFP
jgi:hypothetical protein